jgi:uncharacterized membrane protein
VGLAPRARLVAWGYGEAMIALILLIAGAILVGAAWWVLLLVGLILILVGWYLLSGRRTTAV